VNLDLTRDRDLAMGICRVHEENHPTPLVEAGDRQRGARA
jgi:hypothetical protein